MLTDDERAQLVRWARRASSAQALALRSKIVLRAADGVANTVVAAELGTSAVTVGKWRKRFLQYRLDGLSDEPRAGRPPSITLDQVEQVLTAIARLHGNRIFGILDGQFAFGNIRKRDAHSLNDRPRRIDDF